MDNLKSSYHINQLHEKKVPRKKHMLLPLKNPMSGKAVFFMEMATEKGKNKYLLVEKKRPLFNPS